MTKTKRLKQADAADMLLKHIRERLEDGDGPVHGYAKVTELLGYRSSAGVYAGQVCSRIDLACYLAGLPMLTLHWVRKPDGSMNRNALVGWEVFGDELLREAQGHDWCLQDLDSAQQELDSLPSRAAHSLWKEVEEESPAAWRRRLHARVPRWISA